MFLIAAFTAFAISLSKKSAPASLSAVFGPLLWLILFTVALQTLFTQGGSVLSVGNYFHYPVWCDEWAIYFLSFCFNYFSCQRY